MWQSLKRLIEKVRRRFDHGDVASPGERSVEKLDAAAQAMSSSAGGAIPPNYVKEYDEGRPRH
jgi:hypothetical protein